MRTGLRNLMVLGAVALAVGTALWLRERPGAGPQPRESGRASVIARDSTRFLPGSAARSANGTEVGALACIPQRSALPEKPEAAIEAETTFMRQRWLASTNPEHLAAAALLPGDPVDRMATIRQALAAGGDNPVIIWAAARICSAAKAQDACAADRIAERLVAIDPLNSETWMFEAVQRLKRGDEAGALAAVQRAAAAPESRIYWAETIALAERAYAAGSDYSFAERASAAMGLAAANLPHYSDYTRMCATRLEASRSWAQACLDHAELAERRGDSIIGESVARSMQVSALKGLGDQEKLAAVTARQEQARISRGEGSADDGELMLSSPGLFAEYLDVLSQKGESAALDWRRAAAARLRAELPPCRD